MDNTEQNDNKNEFDNKELYENYEKEPEIIEQVKSPKNEINKNNSELNKIDEEVEVDKIKTKQVI